MAAGHENRKISKKRKYKNFLVFAVLILLLAGIGIVIFIQQQKGSENLKFIEDALAEDGTIKKGTDEKKLMEAVQKETDKSKFGYGINSKIEFLNGKSSGAFCIENPSTNKFDMKVKMIRDDTKETIYASASIPPGYGIESARLNTELKKGQYACTAVLWAMSEGEKVGEIQMPILILIQK